MESRYLYRAFVRSVASGFTGFAEMACDDGSLVLKLVLMAFAGFSLYPMTVPSGRVTV